MRSAARVLQAADLCLHQPLEAVGQLPADLQEIFTQARERTALKIFEAAVAHNVDWLLLCGSLADFEAEPRLACFLMEQFRRLHAAQVSVLWVTNSPGQLPGWALRPEHITVLKPEQSIRVFSLRSDLPVDLFWRASDDSASPSTVGQCPADAAASALQIVLTGTPRISSIDAIVPGDSDVCHITCRPVQPSGPTSDCESGAWLLKFPVNQAPHVETIETATVRWVSETVDLEQISSRNDLLAEVSKRLQQLQATTRKPMTCVQWVLVGTGLLWDELIKTSADDQLLHDIRKLTSRESRVWTYAIRRLPSRVQLDLWRRSPVVANGLHQLDQLSAADLAASASEPQISGVTLRSHPPMMSEDKLDEPRIRLVRELRSPVVPGESSNFN